MMRAAMHAADDQQLVGPHSAYASSRQLGVVRFRGLIAMGRLLRLRHARRCTHSQTLFSCMAEFGTCPLYRGHAEPQRL
jgi:hypothetical protein